MKSRSTTFPLGLYEGCLICDVPSDYYTHYAAARLVVDVESDGIIDGQKFFYINEVLTNISVRKANLSANVLLMDKTRSIVGLRAKSLWKEFKRGIKFYSIKGILSLKRYIEFKFCSYIVGFPNAPKFNKKTMNRDNKFLPKLIS